MELNNHAKIENDRYEMTVSVDAKTFNSTVEKVYRRENKRISIPGFRKGKAPRTVIERMYGEGFFYEEALNELLPEAFETAVNGTDIEYIGRPEIEVPEINKESGATIKFTVQLRPELTVKKYKGLEAEKQVNTVEDADVEREIDLLKERASRMVTVEDRAAADKDIAVIDFEGFMDGEAFPGGKGERFDLTLGSGQFIPGFEEQIVGHNIGDEFDINVKFPDEYSATELAGKDATFKIKLHELRAKEYPEVDDEFAKDVSEFDTLDELKNSIRDRLAKEAEERGESEFENKLLELVTEELEGDVPEVMIEDHIDDMMRNYDMRLRSQGLDLGTYLKYTGMDEQSFRVTFKEQAEKQVRGRLALEAIARAENVTVTDEDVTAEYERLAGLYETDIERVKALVTEKDLRSDLKATKAIEILKDNAKQPKAKKSTKKAKKADDEAEVKEESAE